MKNLIFILLTLFIFLGCSTSSLNLSKEKELILKYNSSDLKLTNKVLNSNFLNFKNLFVTISKLEDDYGRVLFYEDARTDLNFEFVYGGLYTVMYIFDDRKTYELVYERNNLKFVQLKLKDERYLNIIIQASDSQVFSYVYGFSNEEFIKIINTIKQNNEKIQKLKYKATIFDNLSKSLSKWNDELVFFTPLIAPFRALGGL
nr:hypothetical protein [uncultured Sulfurimonas sp.]